MTTIGLLIFDGAEELDFVGPWEVFTMAKVMRDDIRVVTIAERAEPVRCAKGMRVIPDHTIADAPPLDVVMVPGGQGTRREVNNPVLIEWLRKVGPSLQWVTSVCTGALLLCEAGFARDKRVTTHWAFVGVALAQLLDERPVRGDALVAREAGLTEQERARAHARHPLQ